MPLFYIVRLEPSGTEKSRWQKSPVANLVCQAASRIYYARVRVMGKLIWRILELPELNQFLSLVTKVGTAGARFSKDCADFIEVLGAPSIA